MTLRELDLSGAELSHYRFFHCTFVDCVFDQAELDDWRMWSCHVIDCSFVESRYAGGMGGWKRNANAWRRCDFTSADLRDTAHHRETYEDCDFSHARLTRVDFQGSHHIRSRFSGAMSEVEFRAFPRGTRRRRRPNPMLDVDFSTATVRWGTFDGLDLSRCIFPASADHLRLDDRRELARRVLTAIDLSRQPYRSLRIAMARHLAEAARPTSSPGFVHRDDLGDDEAERAAAEAIMRHCGAY